MSAKRRAITTRFKSEAEMVAGVENDLISARRGSRFEDVVFHLDELVAVHTHTEDDLLRARCAALLSAPETVQKAT